MDINDKFQIENTIMVLESIMKRYCKKGTREYQDAEARIIGSYQRLRQKE